jgi:acetylornithine deacetylase/succinyl-diaminopimelate desuccinylase-like protein
LEAQASPPAELLSGAERFWHDEALPALEEFIRIPALSPDFDPEWERNGYLLAAAEHIRGWADRQGLDDATAEILRLPGLTPVVVVDVPAFPVALESTRPTLLYGHLDKQPPAGPWRLGAGPFEPTRTGDALYGRGAADDGYAVFAALGALRLLREQGHRHGRCVILVEASEESMSVHLAPYLDDARFQSLVAPDGPGLAICLDSGSPTYDRLWVTTSMRGHAVATVRVDVLAEEADSGGWGGVVPDSYRLVRQLLSRIEDEHTGRILVDECYAEVPPHRVAELEALARDGGHEALGSVPRLPDAPPDPAPSAAELVRLLRAQTWEPALAVTGAGGLPAVADGGSVIRPFTTLKLSIRLAPAADPERAADALRAALTANPPTGARVTFELLNLGAGFDAPRRADWLEQAITDASRHYFGLPAAAVGRGGTNPFLSTMRARFPDAQILATGVLGPGSNAHAPDEMLHLPTAHKLTACVAHILGVVP